MNTVSEHGHELPEMYQHYKGDYYVLMRIAKHHSGSAPWAVYRPLGNADDLYIRPMSGFNEYVHTAEGKVRRFRKVSNEEANDIVFSSLREQAIEAEANAQTPEDQMSARLARKLIEKISEKAQA